MLEIKFKLLLNLQKNKKDNLGVSSINPMQK